MSRYNDIKAEAQTLIRTFGWTTVDEANWGMTQGHGAVVNAAERVYAKIPVNLIGRVNEDLVLDYVTKTLFMAKHDD